MFTGNEYIQGYEYLLVILAAFAAGALRRLLARSDALVVRVLVEVHPDIGMARLTDVAADEAGWRGRSRLLGACA